MRIVALTVLLLSVFAAACIAPAGNAVAAANTSFVSWALERSNECDARWNRISLGRDANRPERFGGAALRTGRQAVEQKGAKLSHSVITTRSFIHTIAGNAAYLPLSTRERNGASRGTSRLQSPAKTRLTVPYDVRRPIHSSIQTKSFFREFGTTVSRPKLESFGRISKVDRHHRGTVSRPAYRATRPRIL
jgi:hypothetical protein